MYNILHCEEETQNDFNSYCQSRNINLAELTAEQSQPLREIVHTITIDDSLEGLSLQYGVSANKIKNHNNLTSDSIYFLKTIRIPNPVDNYTQNETQSSAEVLGLLQIDYFCQTILKGDDKNRKVARYYLSENNWKLRDAQINYENDLRFEETHKKGEQNKNKVQEVNGKWKIN